MSDPLEGGERGGHGRQMLSRRRALADLGTRRLEVLLQVQERLQR